MKRQSFFIILFLLSLTFFAQPVNDTCATAENIAVTTSETTINFDIADTSINNETGCTGTSGDYGDIWYEFTMPINGNIYINSIFSINNFALYDSCSGSQIHCPSSYYLFTNLESGTTYKLRVYRSLADLDNLNGLYFGITVIAKPTNDDCMTAQSLTVSYSESTTSFNMFGATLSTQETCTGASQEILDIWYSFTMPIDGKFVISGFVPYYNSSVDTFTLYDGCSGNQIQCGSLSQFGGLVAGTNYKLRMSNELLYLNGIEGNPSFKYFMIDTPLNDDCDSTESLSVTTSVTTVNYDIDGAILETSSRCNGSGVDSYADIWYDFTMPVNGNLIIDTAFYNENYYEIFDACGTTRLDCGYNDFVFYNLSSDTNYKLRLFRAEDQLFEDFWDQTFDIRAIEISSNDDCSNSENITVTTTIQEISTSFGGLLLSEDTSCANGTNVVDLWYDFTMPIDGIIMINESNGNGNYFALYDNCNGTEIDCFSSQGNFLDLTMGTNYKLRFFDNNAFYENVDFTIQAVDALSLDEQTLDESISVYPNPASDYINIELTYDQTILAINCYDIFGKKVLKTSQNTQLDLSKLMSGMYFIEIKTDIGSVTKKIIIQ